MRRSNWASASTVTTAATLIASLPAGAADSWQDPFVCVPAPTTTPAATPGAPAPAPVPPTWIDQLAWCGFTLQNTPTDNTQGASFGQSDSSGKSGFKAQFAALYKTPTGFYTSDAVTKDTLTHSALSVIADVDGNLSTASTTSERSSYLNTRIELGYDLGITKLTADTGNGERFPISYRGIRFRAGPMFETTEDYAVRNAMFEAAITGYSFGANAEQTGNQAFQIGQSTPLIGNSVFYRFQPFFTVQAGSNLHGLTLSREFDSTRLRLITEPILDVQIPNAGNLLGLGPTAATLTIDDSFTVDPLEDKTIIINRTKQTSPLTHNLFTVSANFVVGKLAFGPSYSIGQTPPLYRQDHISRLALKCNLAKARAVLKGLDRKGRRD